METKLRQLAALMASRHLFAPDPHREAQIHEVRERWALLEEGTGWLSQSNLPFKPHCQTS